MKLPSLLTRKKLRATTARRSLGAPDEMDYEEMSEPNMKLSRALLIVLVLHVVAVAGIIAFNTIKTRQVSLRAPSGASKSEVATPATHTSVAKPEAPAVTSAPSAVPIRRAEKATASAKPPPESGVADSGRTYVVAKGDNPVS